MQNKKKAGECRRKRRRGRRGRAKMKREPNSDSNQDNNPYSAGPIIERAAAAANALKKG